MKPNCECNKESDCRKNKSTCENKIDCNKVEQVVRDLLKENKTIKQQLDAVLKLVARCDLGGCFDLHHNCGCFDKSKSETTSELIKDVRVDGTTLIITFETTKGDRDITFDLSSIFNPNNYYTKIELDNKLMTLLAEAIATGSFDISLDWESVKNKPSIFNTDWSHVANKPDFGVLLAQASSVLRIWAFENNIILAKEGTYDNTDSVGQVIYNLLDNKFYLKISNTSYYTSWTSSSEEEGNNRVKASNAYCTSNNKPKHNILYYNYSDDTDLKFFVRYDIINGSTITPTLIEMSSSSDIDIDVDSELNSESTNPVENRAIYDQLYGNQSNNKAGLFGRIWNLEHPDTVDEVAESPDIIQVDKTNEYKSFYFKENPIVSAKIRNIEDTINKKYQNISTKYTEERFIHAATITNSYNPLNTHNVEYIIDGVITLNTSTVTLGSNVKLTFKKGGRFEYGEGITNASIQAVGSATISAPRQQLFPRTINLIGSWTIKEVYPEWFYAPGIESKYWYHKRDLVAYNTTINSNNNPNVEVKEDYLDARVMYPADYFVHNNIMARPFYGGDKRNIYLLNLEGGQRLFAIKANDTYYLVWNGCTNYNDYSTVTGAGTVYDTSWAVTNYTGITAKTNVIEAKTPEGHPAYYNKAISLVPVNGEYPFSKTYSIENELTISGSITFNDSSAQTKYTNDGYSDAEGSLDVLIPATNKIESFYHKHRASSASLTDVGKYYTTSIPSTGTAEMMLYAVVTGYGPSVTTKNQNLLDMDKLYAFSFDDIDAGELTFEKYTDYSTSIDRNARTDKKLDDIGGTPVLPRGLQTLAEFNTHYNNYENRDYAYGMGYAYTCIDVYYDEYKGQFLLHNPFEIGENGKAVLYTEWQNDSEYNVKLVENNEIVIKPIEDRLYSNVFHRLAEVTDIDDVDESFLDEVSSARTLKIYRKETNSLIPIEDELIEHYGNENGDYPAIQKAVNIAQDKVTLDKDKVYFINYETITFDGKQDFVFDGNGAVLLVLNTKGIKAPLTNNKLTFNRYSSYNKIRKSNSISYIHTIVDNKHVYTFYTNDNEYIYFPDIFSGSAYVKAESKTSTRKTLFELYSCINTVVKNLKGVSIKESSAGGSGAGASLSSKNLWGSEWRLSASTSKIDFCSSAPNNDALRIKPENIIFYNIYLNNFYGLFDNAYLESKNNPYKRAVYHGDVYFDRIVHVRCEQGIQGRGFASDSAYFSNMQLGQASLQGPAGAHLVYVLGSAGKYDFTNCHFYNQDDRSTAELVTFHGLSSSSARLDVIFRDCLFDGSSFFDGGIAVRSISCINCTMLQSFGRICATYADRSIDVNGNVVSNGTDVRIDMGYTNGTPIPNNQGMHQLNIINCNIVVKRALSRGGTAAYATTLNKANYSTAVSCNSFSRKLNIKNSIITITDYVPEKDSGEAWLGNPCITWQGNVDIQNCVIHGYKAKYFLSLDNKLYNAAYNPLNKVVFKNNHIVIDRILIGQIYSDNIEYIFDGNTIQFVNYDWLEGILNKTIVPADNQDNDTYPCYVIYSSTTSKNINGDKILFKDTKIQSAHGRSPKILLTSLLKDNTHIYFMGDTSVYNTHYTETASIFDILQAAHDAREAAANSTTQSDNVEEPEPETEP